MVNNKKFITFEGCEGVGKSTQVRLLCEYLDKQKTKYLLIREPGGTKISEEIRGILLDKENHMMCNNTELLLYAAARAQLINEKIKPALAEDYLVICDRYVDSTLAYQGKARNLGMDTIFSLHKSMCDNFYPSLTIFLDLNPKTSFKRKGGQDVDDRLELENIEFHEKVYEGYKELVKIFKGRIKAIKPDGDKFNTQEKIRAELRARGLIK